MALRIASWLAAFALVGAACAAPTTSDRVDDGVLTVVATTSVIGDLVARVVDGRGRVEVLIPAGVDPHSYQPSVQQAGLLRDADLIVANGLGLEASLADALASAVADGAEIVEIGPAVDPLPSSEDPDEHEAGHDHGDADDLDPHVWLDPVRMAEAVRVIADALPDVAGTDWSATAELVATELATLDRELATILDRVPVACRVLVTDHDSFGYLAARYGFDVIGTVIPGSSTAADPSARDFAALVDVVRDAGVSAVFVGEARPTRQLDALAADVGRPVAVISLFSDALGAPGSGAETYETMLRTDANRIADALVGCERS